MGVREYGSLAPSPLVHVHLYLYKWNQTLSFPFFLLQHGNDVLKFIFYFRSVYHHFDVHLYSNLN